MITFKTDTNTIQHANPDWAQTVVLRLKDLWSVFYDWTLQNRGSIVVASWSPARWVTIHHLRKVNSKLGSQVTDLLQIFTCHEEELRREH